MDFDRICTVVKNELDLRWKTYDESDRMQVLEKEKRAIMGYEEEMEEYKKQIEEIILEKELENEDFPKWYEDIVDGVFSEIYGLGGISPWVYDKKPEYVKSPSLKLIGERIYCMVEGKTLLLPQRISAFRRERLKRTFLMASPKERLDKGFHEVYLRNGIRITIYSGEKTKEDQDIMVFRKYVINNVSLIKLAELNTISKENINIFKTMIDIGFNIIFSGPVRTGKTTFLQAWQQLEKNELEGLAIATDPETPWHKLMPEAPIMQLIADDKELENITKSILRGDNDYVLLEEMRDATAFNLALEIMSIGTKRSKATVHSNDPINMPYRIANKIREKYGGNLKGILQQIFNNFDFVFQLNSDFRNPNHKLLKGIWSYEYDVKKDEPWIREIMRYDWKTGNWEWRKDFNPRLNKSDWAEEELMVRLKKEIEEQSIKLPLNQPLDICPKYYEGGTL